MIIINIVVVIIIMLLSVVHAILALLENLNFHSFCFVNLFTVHLTSGLRHSDVDATSARRITVGVASLRRHVPLGMNELW